MNVLPFVFISKCGVTFVIFFPSEERHTAPRPWNFVKHGTIFILTSS